MIELTTEEKTRINEAVERYKEKHPDHRILFATVSGSHLYGTKTDDADIDLRGCYIVPTKQFLGLNELKMTTEYVYQDVEFEFHEIGKFLKLLSYPNMNFVEFLMSPLRVVWTPEADELLKIAGQVISKEMFPHIQGMSIHTWKHAEREHFQIPKRNLYLYREVLRGLVLFEKEQFVSDVKLLAEMFGDVETVRWVNYLLERKKNAAMVESVHVRHIKENIRNLQSKMLTTKEFSTLSHENKLDMKKTNRWLIGLRNWEMRV